MRRGLSSRASAPACHAPCHADPALHPAGDPGPEWRRRPVPQPGALEREAGDAERRVRGPGGRENDQPRSSQVSETCRRGPRRDVREGASATRRTQRTHSPLKNLSLIYLFNSEYEFCGPTLGPAALLLGLPATCYALIAACNGTHGCVGGVADLLKPWPGLPRPLFTWAAFAAVPLWFLFQAGLHLLLPGPVVLGAPLRDGRRLPYKLTGLANLGVTLLLAALLGFSPATVAGPASSRLGFLTARLPAGLGGWLAGSSPAPLRLAWAHDNVVPLLTSACIWSGLLSAALFAASFRGRAGPAGSKPLLALGGDTPSSLYNFFMGRELNPRGDFGAPGRLGALLARFDWKEFCELYPGLIGWVVLDLAACASALSSSRAIPPPLAMVTAFHTLYVADALAHEKSILTTMDITTDGFGFMLAFGDLTWVPFIYSLPARYAADFTPSLSKAGAAAIYALFFTGYAIFRGSNSQKDAFRTDPSSPAVAHLKTLTTASGRRLLVSGWWGTARHINYLGDWLLGLAWCLPCGGGSCVPYFYAVYFGVLLGECEEREKERKKKREKKAVSAPGDALGRRSRSRSEERGEPWLPPLPRSCRGAEPWAAGRRVLLHGKSLFSVRARAARECGVLKCPGWRRRGLDQQSPGAASTTASTRHHRPPERRDAAAEARGGRRGWRTSARGWRKRARERRSSRSHPLLSPLFLLYTISAPRPARWRGLRAQVRGGLGPVRRARAVALDPLCLVRCEEGEEMGGGGGLFSQ